MTRVLLIPIDSEACSSYRIIWPARALNDPDFRIESLTDNVLDGNADADVVVLQRPQHKLMHQGILLLKRKGVRVVVELDDNLEELPEGHPIRDRIDPKNNADNNWEWTRRCVDEADELVCSTPGIAEFYGKGVVVENAVPESYTRLERPAWNGNVRVGWTGDPRYHVGDLEVAARGVQRVCPPCMLSIVGARAAFGHLGVVGAVAGWRPLEHYPALVIGAMDVGIAPVANNTFNVCKSWLKPLEYASLGIPFVATRSPEYERLGLGITVDDELDWIEAMRDLCAEGVEALHEKGEKLRSEVLRRNLTVERSAQSFAKAWIGS